MSRLSEGLQETVHVLDAIIGQSVTFNGRTYTNVTVESVAGAQAGEQGVPRAGLSVDIAATDAHVFAFDPRDFTPYTDDPPPKNADILGWNGWDWRVTNPSVENMNTDTLLILIYALRQIRPGLF